MPKRNTTLLELVPPVGDATEPPKEPWTIHWVSEEIDKTAAKDLVKFLDKLPDHTLAKVDQILSWIQREGPDEAANQQSEVVRRFSGHDNLGLFKIQLVKQGIRIGLFGWREKGQVYVLMGYEKKRDKMDKETLLRLRTLRDRIKEAVK